MLTSKSRAGGKKGNSAKPAEPYRHPEAESPMRPDVGTQAQFKKKKPPVVYRYDSSLSPALDWDGQNSARGQGEIAKLTLPPNPDGVDPTNVRSLQGRNDLAAFLSVGFTYGYSRYPASRDSRCGD